MSLSKPVVDVPVEALPVNSTSGGPSSWSIEKIGLIIGIPVAVLSVAGVIYWLTRKPKGGPKGGKGGAGKKTSDSKSASVEDKGSSKQRDVIVTPKPKYLEIKNIGNEMFKRADYAGALESYTAAMEESPPADELAKLFQNRAAVFEKLGDWVQLIRETSAALEIDPKYVKARQRRAKAYQKTGFLDEALEDVTAACLLENFSRQNTIMMADEILKEIGLREATKLMATKKPTAPSDHGVISFLRSFYCDPVTKWWSDRETDYIGTFKSEAKTGELAQQPGGDNSDGDTGDSAVVEGDTARGFIAAITALQNKTFGNILNLCTEELRNPESLHQAETYLLRGTFRFLWGYGDEVLADLTEVTESKTAGPMLKSSAWVKKGLRYALIGENEKCDECFKKAEEACPENVDIFHHLGQCRLTTGNFEGAVDLIDKAHQICPDFAIAAASKYYTEFRVAVNLENQKGVVSALDNFQKCLRKFPDVPDICNLYGQVLMELGQLPEACDQFSSVFKLDPGNAAVYVHYAMCKFRQNQDVDQAIALLRQSLKIDDKCEYVYETLGTLEIQSGDMNSAIISLTKALELARTQQELVMLCSLKRAAEVQSRMKGMFDGPPETIQLSNGIPIPN